MGFQLLTNTAIGYNLEPTQHIISAVSFTCSRCNKQGSYFLKAVSYSVTCSHCGTLYDAYSEELKSRNVSINPDFKPAIELGKTGVLNNKKYLVTGILIKNERSTSYFWEEYVLFNPIHGYAYLTQYDGHWTFLESTVDAPHKIEGENAYAYEKTLFLLFAKYKTEIKGAKGEFPFKLTIDDIPVVEEYIAPPHIIICEKNSTYFEWFKGHYIEPDELKQAFSLDAVPARKGTGVIQPFISSVNPIALKNFLISFGVILIALQFYFSFNSHNDIAYQKSYLINDSLNNTEIYTNTFNLNYGTKNTEVVISSPLHNNWIYCAASLVNEATGIVYDFDLEAEFYSGTEGGESWSEGKGWASKVISQVPEGKYYLILIPKKPDNISSMSLNVSVKRDVDVLSNFLIIVLIIAIFPIYFYVRRNSFEKNRWYNSNFSPYDYDE